MSVLLLPTRTDQVFYTFSTVLDSITFQFQFFWNERDNAWYFSIADSSGNPLLDGIKVRLNLALLARYASIGLPAGSIYAIDTSGQDLEAGLNELGGRVKLLYVEKGT